MPKKQKQTNPTLKLCKVYEHSCNINQILYDMVFMYNILKKQICLASQITFTPELNVYQMKTLFIMQI